MKRKYIAVIYDDRTQNNLRQWCNENNFNLGYDYNGDVQDPGKFDFHTTLFYTTSMHDDLPEEPGYKLIESHRVIPAGFEMLGQEKDIPVIIMEPSGMIQQLRQKYEAVGMKDAWPEYKPHVSLSYAKELVETSSLKLPDFPLTFNKVVIKDLLE